jgi:hypothetical protein
MRVKSLLKSFKELIEEMLKLMINCIPEALANV